MVSDLGGDWQKVEAICRKHGVARLSLFGSVLGSEFGPHSDVDVLVEFLPGRTPGLGFFELQRELTEEFGRRVDLHTPAFLSRYFRDDVLRQAELRYAAS